VKRPTIYLYFIFAVLFFTGRAQDFNDDAAIWLGIKVEKKISKPFAVYLKHQSRFNDNLNSYSLSYLDLGASYKLNKHVKLIAGAVLSRKDPFYELYQNRQRYYGSVNLKVNIKNFELSYRNQTQVQVKHQKGIEYEIYNRNKLSCEYELNKRISLTLSEELYLPLNYRDQIFIDRARSYVSCTYVINKKQSLEPYFLYQTRFITSNNRDFVYGINYSFSF